MTNGIEGNISTVIDIFSSLDFGLSLICMVKIASKNWLPYEVRKVQQSRGLLFFNLPKRFTELLKIRKDELVKIQLVSDETKGNSLSVSKVLIGRGG